MASTRVPIPNTASSTSLGQKEHHETRKLDYSSSSSSSNCSFQMPLHYPRYKKRDYEAMPEWRLDCLLREYGLPLIGDVNQKRRFAMGAFLWPSQNEY